MAGDFYLPGIHRNRFYMGNLNVNHINVPLNIAFGNSLTQVVTGSTREVRNTSSLLDLIFLSGNIPGHEESIHGGISDHKLVFLCFKTTKGRKESKCSIHVPNFSKADDVSVLDYLELAFDQFSASDGARDVDSLWDEFKCIVAYCLEDFILISKVK